MASDVELLDAWAAGDGEAGRMFYGRYAARVARFFSSKTRDDAADLVQRTFLKCLESCRKGAEVGNPAAMLFAIARNELYDTFRRKKDRFTPEVSSIEDLRTGASQLLARGEQQRLLLLSLHRIPLEHQIALELYYWEGLSVEDVARVLSVTKSAAMSRIHRARELLREQMHELEASPERIEETLSGFESWARQVRPEPEGGRPAEK
jgi:RNA polymerase sigma factor (sigma-70 family)